MNLSNYKQSAIYKINFSDAIISQLELPYHHLLIKILWLIDDLDMMNDRL